MNTDDVQYLDWQWVEENPESALDLMLKLHSENAALKDCLDWAETILCNSLPMQHSTLDEWNEIINKWRDSKHAIDAARAKTTEAKP